MLTLTIGLCCICFVIGFIVGKILTPSTSSTDTGVDLVTGLDPTRRCWKIVRYHKGTKEFDCIWSSHIDDKRVADRICARLNNPNGPGNEYLYGDYYVEEM